MLYIMYSTVLILVRFEATVRATIYTSTGRDKIKEKRAPSQYVMPQPGKVHDFSRSGLCAVGRTRFCVMICIGRSVWPVAAACAGVASAIVAADRQGA